MPARSQIPPAPVNLRSFIDLHRSTLRPPAQSRCIWQDRDSIVMIAVGPTQREDFHVNPTEELFLQIEGDIIIRIVDHQGIHRDVPVREGELFLVPPNVPHSPRRPSGTVGMVMERRRPAGEEDHLRYYCLKCGATVHDEAYELVDHDRQLKDMLERFWSDATLRTCMQCGQMVQPATTAAQPPPPEMRPDLPVDAPVASARSPARTRGKVGAGSNGSAVAAKTSAAPRTAALGAGARSILPARAMAARARTSVKPKR